MLATSAEYMPFQIEIGPYKVQPMIVSPTDVKGGRRQSRLDVNRGQIKFSTGLNSYQFMKHFMRQLLYFIHYAHGLVVTANEEFFTDSFATGLGEFAVRNRDAWYWLNREFSFHLSKKVAFHDFVETKHEMRAPPEEVMIFGTPTTIEVQTGKTLKEAMGFEVYGYMDYGDLGVRLNDGLLSMNALVVTWHELVHSMHARLGLEDHHKRHDFVHGQTRAWIDFVKNNPDAWCWFVQMLSDEQTRSRVKYKGLAKE